jgi:hypothetical protein
LSAQADLLSFDVRPYFSKIISTIIRACQQINFPHWPVFLKKSDGQDIISLLLNGKLYYCVYKDLSLFSIQSADRNITLMKEQFVVTNRYTTLEET